MEAGVVELAEGADGLFSDIAVFVAEERFEERGGAPVADLAEDLGGDVAQAIAASGRVVHQGLDGRAA